MTCQGAKLLFDFFVSVNEVKSNNIDTRSFDILKNGNVQQLATSRPSSVELSACPVKFRKVERMLMARVQHSVLVNLTLQDVGGVTVGSHVLVSIVLKCVFSAFLTPRKISWSGSPLKFFHFNLILAAEAFINLLNCN